MPQALNKTLNFNTYNGEKQMNVEFYIKFVLAVFLNYYIGTRFLYDIEINGKSGFTITFPTDRIIKNRATRFLFPKPIKTPSESYGTEKICLIGLIYYLVICLPTQLGYVISFIISFMNMGIANAVQKVVFTVMFLGMIAYGVSALLDSLCRTLKRKNNH